MFRNFCSSRGQSHMSEFKVTGKFTGGQTEKIFSVCTHVTRRDKDALKPNSITLAGSELAANMFEASSELASVIEFGF